MEITKDAKVVTADGKNAGQVTRVVLNPKTKQVTDIVVEKGALFSEDKVVPIDLIASGDQQRLTLRADKGKWDQLPPFREDHYVIINGEELGRQPTTPPPYLPLLYYYPPYATDYPAGSFAGIPSPYIVETEEHIPNNTVALKEGAHVLTIDGKHVGNVERVLTGPEADRATHFVISKGLLLKERKLVPMTWVDNITEDEVRLVVATRTLDELRDYRE